MKSWKRFPLTIFAGALALVMGTTPLAAHAYSQIQYALNRQVSNNVIVSSATATIVGGKVQLGSTFPTGTRVYIQTYASQYVGVIYSASGISPVSFTHGPVNYVVSRCYWNYSFSPVDGTLPINCWRYAP